MQNDETQNYNPDDIRDNKGLAILSYIGFLFIIPMLVNGAKSPFTRFHVNQGLVLFIAEIVLQIVASILRAVLSFIPFVGSLISLAVSVISLIFLVLGIMNAANGTAKRLPVIGNIEIYK